MCIFLKKQTSESHAHFSFPRFFFAAPSSECPGGPSALQPLEGGLQVVLGDAHGQELLPLLRRHAGERGEPALRARRGLVAFEPELQRELGHAVPTPRSPEDGEWEQFIRHRLDAKQL